jgi:hypothetical protein
MNGDIAKKWLGKLTKLNAATGSGKCRGNLPHRGSSSNASTANMNRMSSSSLPRLGPFNQLPWRGS